MDNNVMIFQINKCSDDTRSPEMIARGDKCKSPTEIDSFIERIGVGTWANYY